jgi:hypothetical protein
MKKGLLSAIIVLLTTFNATNAQQKTTLSAEIYGYQRDMVYFDCIQTPLIAQEFYTNPGEEHIYNFDTDRLVCISINGRTNVLLQPGVSLHVNINYDGKNVSVEYSGSERAVNNNRLLSNLGGIKRTLRYKNQLLGCAALDIKPKSRIDDSRILMEKVKALIEKSPASDEAKNYVMALTEYDVYLSFMEYPVMYQSVRGVAIDQQEIGDYWNIMDGYIVRNDAESMNCPEYASLLMRYCFYAKEKAANEKGEKYTTPNNFEDMYNELACFYDGQQRDFVLYTLLCNFIRNGQDIERADVLYKDYIEKYNKDNYYRSILDLLLQ